MRVRVPNVDWTLAEGMGEFALHEAIHATTACALGVPVRLITIKPGANQDGRYGGYTTHNGCYLPDDRWQDYATISLAPLLLFLFDRRLAGKISRVSAVGLFSHALGNGCHSDWELAEQIAKEFAPRAPAAHLEGCLNRASEIVERHWSEIVNLARALGERQELGEAEILQTLGPWTDDIDFDDWDDEED